MTEAAGRCMRWEIWSSQCGNVGGWLEATTRTNYGDSPWNRVMSRVTDLVHVTIAGDIIKAMSDD